MNIDFTNLNDVYHLSMIVIGFGGLVVAALSLKYLMSKTNKQAISSTPKSYKKNYRKKK